MAQAINLIGFWRANLRTGEVFADPVASAMHGARPRRQPSIGDVLASVTPRERATFIRAALRAFKSAVYFDQNLAVQEGVALRVMGGRAYDSAGETELHGIVEVVRVDVDSTGDL